MKKTRNKVTSSNKNIGRKLTNTTQKMKFSIKDFFSKCDQISGFLRNWSHLLKKSLMETLFFVQSKLLKSSFYKNLENFRPVPHSSILLNN